MPLEPPPLLPQRSDKTTFADRADAAWAWLVNSFFPQIVAIFSALGPGNPYGTVGGTANALTLTTGVSLAALTMGQRVRFRPTAANTGSATINPDGLGAKPAKTITGAELPPGYLRAGVSTSAEWDGTAFVVDRLTEVATNANGTFVRYAHGEMRCIRTQMNSSASGETTWTYPASFVTAPALSAGVLSTANAVLAGVFSAISATSAAFAVYNNTNARVAQPTDLTATGFWYLP